MLSHPADNITSFRPPFRLLRRPAIPAGSSDFSSCKSLPRQSKDLHNSPASWEMEGNFSIDATEVAMLYIGDEVGRGLGHPVRR